LLTKFLNKS